MAACTLKVLRAVGEEIDDYVRRRGHLAREVCRKIECGDAIGSNRDEPGCLRFDVLQDNDDANLIHLYEVYQDEASLEAHRQAPHYLKWRDAVKDWREGDPIRSVCTNVYPVDDAWR